MNKPRHKEISEEEAKKQFLVTLTVDVGEDENEDIVLYNCAKAVERETGYVTWRVGIEEIKDD